MQIPVAVLAWRKNVQDVLLKDSDITLALMLAMIWQESGGQQYAFRYEPEYQYFCDLKGNPLYSAKRSYAQNRAFAQEKLGLSEFYLQSSSHGLLQIMGAVAREQMLTGWIPQLYDPKLNIEHSIRLLHRHIRRYKDVRVAVMRYNGAGPAAIRYRDEVFEKAAALERLL